MAAVRAWPLLLLVTAASLAGLAGLAEAQTCSSAYCSRCTSRFSCRSKTGCTWANSRCTSSVVTCATGLTLCTSTCKNLTSDATACGSCTTPCTGGKVCSGAACVCPTGLNDCSGTCKNLSSTTDCGVCGNACTGGKVCNGAACVCPTGLNDCSGTCKNLSSTTDCGVCGNACTGGKVCNGAACLCPTGLNDCSGTCKNLSSTTDCGVCGNACTGGKVCNGAACVCPGSLTDCGDGICRNLASDSAACGVCGTQCVSPQTCVSSACQDPPPRVEARLAFGPLRQFWPDSQGYCGEHSVQMSAAYYGVWVSQRQAYAIGRGEVLVGLGAGVRGDMATLVNTQLGLNYTEFVQYTSITTASLTSFMVNFIKRQLLAGAPVIITARCKGLNFDDYDHIMPAYGFTYSPGTASTYDATDALTWTTGYKNEVSRVLGAVGQPTFFATGRPAQTSNNCSFDMPGGCCISADAGHYAASITGLKSNFPGFYLPMRLQITGWSNGSPADDEPWAALGSTTSPANGTYLLDLRRAALPAGTVFTVFRFNRVAGSVFASGNALQTLGTVTAVNNLCTSAAANCKKATFTVGVAPLTDPANVVLPDATTTTAFGRISSNSVVFFVAVKGQP